MRELDGGTAGRTAHRPRIAPVLRALWADEAGATMVEYAFMVLLVATACVGAVAVFGQAVLGLFTTVPAAL